MSIISRYLDTVGDGTGNRNFNEDYSSVEGRAKIKPPAGETYRLARMIISVEDTGGFTASKYGNLAALTNGVEIKVFNKDGASEMLDLTAGLPIVKNAQWGALCYDVDLKDWGAGNDLLLVRWTFSTTGSSIVLDGDDEQSLEVIFNDDLTGLIDHRFMIQGNFN